MTEAAGIVNQLTEARPAWPGLWDTDESGPYLVGARCRRCGHVALGPREMCPKCFAGDALEEARIGRTGTLYSATVIHQGPSGFTAPYRVGYVDIEHGLRIFAHAAGGSGAPQIGDEVELTIAPVRRSESNGDLTGPLYRAVGAKEGP